MVSLDEARASFLSRYAIHHVARWLRWGEQTRSARLVAFPVDLIGREMAVAGVYELHGIKAVQHLCTSGAIKPGVFVDVGANIGTYSCAMAGVFTEVHAFEPHPISSLVLEVNRRICKADNCHVHTVALAEAAGELVLIEEDGNLGGATVAPKIPGGNKSYRVVSANGDDYISPLLKGVPLAFVKADVEGGELSVLRGMRRLLLDHRPVVSFEADVGEQSERVREFLRSIGYTSFKALDLWPRFNSRWIRVVLSLVFGARYQFRNVTHLGDRRYSLVFAFPETVPEL
jgi:FkbM family methyltransferase